MHSGTHATEDALFAKWARKVKRSLLQEALFAVAQPGIISFPMDGVAGPGTIPRGRIDERFQVCPGQ